MLRYRSFPPWKRLPIPGASPWRCQGDGDGLPCVLAVVRPAEGSRPPSPPPYSIAGCRRAAAGWPRPGRQNCVITSPCWMPAFSAGLPCSTATTPTPVGMPYSWVMSWGDGLPLDAKVGGLAGVYLLPGGQVHQFLQAVLCLVDGDGETDVVHRAAAAGGGSFRLVDADELPGHVQQGAAGVAGIDGGVRLDEPGGSDSRAALVG